MIEFALILLFVGCDEVMDILDGEPREVLAPHSIGSDNNPILTSVLTEYEDTDLFITTSNLLHNTPYADKPDALINIKIVELPNNGILTLGEGYVELYQIISSDEIADLQLIFRGDDTGGSTMTTGCLKYKISTGLKYSTKTYQIVINIRAL